MGYTKTQIANEALLMIGEEPIGNIDDATGNPSRWIRQTWDLTAEEVQKTFPWKELKVETSLSRHPDTTSQNQFRYEMPGDLLRLEYVDPDFRPWNVFGNFIVVGLRSDRASGSTNTETLYIEYTKRTTDPSSWSSDLAECMKYVLAAKIAPNVIRDGNERRREIMEEYRALILPDARRRQSADKRSISYRPEQGSWIPERGPRFFIP